MFSGGTFRLTLTHAASVYESGDDGEPTSVVMYPEGHSNVGIWGIDELDGEWTFVPWTSIAYATKGQ